MTAPRRIISTVLATLVVCLSLVNGGAAGAAPGATVDAIGWWSRTNQEPTLGSVLADPTVTPGQLVVEGTTEGATAVAAIRATLPDGTTARALSLRVASEVGGENAVLLACRGDSTWKGAHAGSWEKRPSPDCEQPVEGVLAADGSSWSFDLSSLQTGPELDLVLTPGTDPDLPEGLDGSTFRAVFARPTGSDIEVSEEASADPDFDVPDVELAPAPSTGAAGGSPSFGGDTGEPSTFSVPAPGTEDQEPADASSPSEEQDFPDSSPQLSAPRPLERAGADGDAGRVLAAFVVLVGVGVLVWSTTQAVPERQLLSRFAANAGGATTSVVRAVSAADRVGGLGRFRRERSTPARRLGG